MNKNSKNISFEKYFLKESWGCFKNNNRSLMKRSIWTLGATKYKNKVIHNKPTEDITIYYPHNEKQLRAFNLNQNCLDERTINEQLKNPNNIVKYIEEVRVLEDNIYDKFVVVNEYINKNDYNNFVKSFEIYVKEISKLFSYEYLISSLSTEFYNRNVEESIIEKVNEWKNGVPMKMFDAYEISINYALKHYNMDTSFDLVYLYINITEFIDLLKGKLKPNTLIKRINNRMKNGCVYLNFQDKRYRNKVIQNKKIINVVRNKFEEIQNEILNENFKDKVLKGNSTFKNGKKVEGECIVIKDNNSDLFGLDLKDKIFVCPITTCKDVLYLNNIKGLITDNGGVLCHSAIFSREFEIPCIVGCEVATKVLKTGDVVVMDLDNECIIIK